MQRQSDDNIFTIIPSLSSDFCRFIQSDVIDSYLKNLAEANRMYECRIEYLASEQMKLAQTVEMLKNDHESKLSALRHEIEQLKLNESRTEKRNHSIPINLKPVTKMNFCTASWCITRKKLSDEHDTDSVQSKINFLCFDSCHKRQYL